LLGTVRITVRWHFQRSPDAPVAVTGNTSFHRGKEDHMADKVRTSHIKPELADHLAAAMNTPDLPGPAVAGATGMPQQNAWPDGNGKRRHSKERGSGLGRMGHEAAVTAVHRTSRPQMPHSS
jgi:hypothetical protein